MINLAVIDLKEIKLFFKKVIITILLIMLIHKCAENENIKDSFSFKTFLTNNIENLYYTMFDNNILISNYYHKVDKDNESKIKNILSSELALLNQEEILMEKENQEEIMEINETIYEDELLDDIVKNDDIKIESMHTEVLKENNKTDKYTDIYKTVQIKNESKYQLTEEIVTPNVDFKNKKDIIIFHTHTCESYTPTENDNYIASGNFRTTDYNNNVVAVGKELMNSLTNFGYLVTQDVTYHDYPAYTGSYNRSLATINNIVKNNNAEFIIDLHRDALGSNSAYAPRVKIGDDVAAQLMFVMGTDGGGLEHPNWKNNLKLAIKIQEKANELYPGLFKPIILRNSRYNQHVSTGACIIEVGATGNTLAECKTSMKYLANVLSEVMK